MNWPVVSKLTPAHKNSCIWGFRRELDLDEVTGGGRGRWTHDRISGLIRREGLPWWFTQLRSGLQCRRLRPGFDPWIGTIPWSRKWQPTPVFLPGEFHGQRSLVGCSPWGRRESDTAEHTITAGRRGGTWHSLCPVRTQQEGSHLQAKERGLSRSQPSRHLTWGLPASHETLSKPLGLRYFVSAAQAE